MALPEWLLLVAGLLGLTVPIALLAQRLRLPLSVLLAVTGLLAGILGQPYGLDNPLRAETFQAVITFLFLPVLVFEAALGVSLRVFVRNLPAILVLAIPALIVNAGLVGLGLHWALGLPLLVGLVLGVLISATDPVAVIAVFRRLGVPERLLTIVEGESLLNDAVAIVAYQMLLIAALGGTLTLTGASLTFLWTFFGGVLAGGFLGMMAALLLHWLDTLAGAALTVALAYGGFVAAEHLAGLSGVTATAAAGLVLNAFLPSRARRSLRTGLHTLWTSLAYIANSLLFLLVGLALDHRLLLTYWPAILLALGIVLAARALAVLAVVSPLEQVAGLPRLGWRNQAVLIWGGLRGGIALALALALPEDLAQRELLVALTGGVVLGSLLINATTIGTLVHRLGLDRPSRTQRFLAAGAQLSGVRAAQRQLAELGLKDTTTEAELGRVETTAQQELANIHLNADEELDVITHRALFVEHHTYQQLADAGLLPPPVARSLLREVNDHIEQAHLTRHRLAERRRQAPRFDRLVEYLLARMLPPLGIRADELAYAEASARRLAARHASKKLALLEELPQIHPASVRQVQDVFAEWEHEAEQELAQLDAQTQTDRAAIHHRQAEGLSRMAARSELMQLAHTGLLPLHLAQDAANAIARQRKP